MPRNVRNFWIEASIDGRSADFNGGPQSKDGGFRLTIKQRADGEIVKAFEINGYMARDGKTLRLLGETATGQTITFETYR
jgi:hypothetical protein